MEGTGFYKPRNTTEMFFQVKVKQLVSKLNVFCLYVSMVCSIHYSTSTSLHLLILYLDFFLPFRRTVLTVESMLTSKINLISQNLYFSISKVVTLRLECAKLFSWHFINLLLKGLTLESFIKCIKRGLSYKEALIC